MLIRAQVERALKMWKGGVEVDVKDKRNFGFNPWGDRLEFHVSQLSKFKDQHWKKVDLAVKKYVDVSDVSYIDGDEEVDKDIGMDVVVVLSDDDDA